MRNLKKEKCNKVVVLHTENKLVASIWTIPIDDAFSNDYWYPATLGKIEGLALSANNCWFFIATRGHVYILIAGGPEKLVLNWAQQIKKAILRYEKRAQKHVQENPSFKKSLQPDDMENLLYSVY